MEECLPIKGGFLVPAEAPFDTVEFCESDGLCLSVTCISGEPEFESVDRINLSLRRKVRGLDLAGYFSIELSLAEAKKLAHEMLALIDDVPEEEGDEVGGDNVDLLLTYVTIEAYFDGEQIIVPEPAPEDAEEEERRGFIAALNPEQQVGALAYRGADTLGD